MRKNPGYQTDKLVPLYLFETTPIGLAVRNDSPFKTVKDLMDFAKKNKGVITVAGVRHIRVITLPTSSLPILPV